MRLDLLGTRCMCGPGVITRGTLALLHRDPPGILRCTFCRIPYARYEYPLMTRLRRRKFKVTR